MTIKAFQQIEQDKAKEIIAQNYNLAYLTATFTLNGMNGKAVPQISELFPDMFPPPPANDDKDALALALYKEQMLDFAAAHNKKRQRIKEGEQI